ncbi:MAG: glutamate carboxypeptidase [Thermoanaerobaculia bacterium]|nr:glutamate carboxypeptidase [Thermoanaerobaculia bacterium]
MEPMEEGTIERIVAEAEAGLVRLCAISSESGNAAGIRSVADQLRPELERHGLLVEVVDEPDANGKPQPVLIARGPSADGNSHLLLLGHMDTVLPAIEPQIEGRTLFATGSLDMKGGLAMLLGALDVLAARGEQFPPDILVVLVPDEESESLISGDATNRWSRNARAVLVLEPGQARANGETLVAGRRGMVEWKLEISGRASHSGLAYWAGRSAVAAAADWCARAQGLSRNGTGPTVNVGRLIGGGADFVRDLARHHDLVGTSRQLNVISDYAVAEGEFRFLTPTGGEAMLAELTRLTAEIAASHEVAATFTPGMQVAPVDPDGPGAALVQRTVELGAKRGLHLEVEDDRGGISFPNFIADPAKTPVVDGLGPTGDGMHIRGEFLNLDSLGPRILLLADLLATL